MSKIKDKLVSMPSWLLGLIYFSSIAYNCTGYFIPEEQGGLVYLYCLLMLVFSPSIYFIFKTLLHARELISVLANAFALVVFAGIFCSLFEPAVIGAVLYHLCLYLVVVATGWFLIEHFREIHA